MVGQSFRSPEAHGKGGLSGLHRSEAKTVVEDPNVLVLRSNFSSTYYALRPGRGGCSPCGVPVADLSSGLALSVETMKMGNSNDSTRK